METNNARNYKCKDIEFIVICGFVLFSFKRDLSFFSKFSKKYMVEYVLLLETELANLKELVEPQSELVEQKAITDHMRSVMHALQEPLDWVKGYIQLAGTGINISVKDFGIVHTREAINNLDIEEIIKGMHTVNANVVKYKPILVEQGLTDELQTQLVTDAESIANDRQKRYEILTNRKAILQNNVGVLNTFHAKILEILKVGKILFKDSDPVKLQEYTFSELLKKVRKISKPDTDNPDKDTDIPATDTGTNK
jgi:predicted RNA-binding protein with EMAP domain